MTEVQKITSRLGFIGGGNMAKAIAEGVVSQGLMSYDQIYVSGPTEKNLQVWMDKGAHVSTLNGFVVDESDIVFLAVKPHLLDVALDNAYETKKEPFAGKLFVSVLAGVTISQLQNALKRFPGSLTIRTMPNTPLMVGKGCTAICPEDGLSWADVKLVQTILGSSGLCVQVPERLINSIGGLSGCGPAFVYLMIEALADGGVKMGIPRQMAIQLAAQTFLGSAEMVLKTGKHTAILRDEVCSPGGTTIAGVHELEKGNVRSSIMNALETSTKKSAELGENAQKKQ